MKLFILGLAGVVISGLAASPLAAKDLNDYVLQAVASLSKDYSRGGYDLGSAFTHDVEYADGTVKKTSSAGAPAPSMCVAGVTEVLLTAINLYVTKTADRSPYSKAPLVLWARGNKLSLRANLFMFAGTGSRGTGDTLKRFRMGQELGFGALKAGDFVNLNRTTRSGHAVVFLGYIDGVGDDLATAENAKGFKYFSLQGKGKPDAGFGYRWAFFEGTCPTLANGRVRDCHVIRSSNPVLLNAGRLSVPSEWNVAVGLATLREQGIRDITGASPGVSRAAAADELERELPAVVDPTLDGISGE